MLQLWLLLLRVRLVLPRGRILLFHPAHLAALTLVLAAILAEVPAVFPAILPPIAILVVAVAIFIVSIAVIVVPVPVVVVPVAVIVPGLPAVPVPSVVMGDRRCRDGPGQQRSDQAGDPSCARHGASFSKTGLPKHGPPARPAFPRGGRRTELPVFPVPTLRNMPAPGLIAALVLLAAPSFAQVAAQAPAPPIGTLSMEMIAGSGPFYGTALDLIVTPSDPLDLDFSYRLAADDLRLQHTFGAGLTWHATRALAMDLSAELSPVATADTFSPTGQPQRFSFGRVGVLGAVRLTPPLEEGSHPARALVELEAALFDYSVEQSVGGPSIGGSYNQLEVGLRVGATVRAFAWRLRGSYYVYDRDLSQIAGVRVPRGGEGEETLVTHPQQFDARASLRQRFGADESWSATLSGGYTQYVAGVGDLALAGLRVVHSFGRDFRGFGGVQLLVERLADLPGSPTTVSGVGSAGVEFDF